MAMRYVWSYTLNGHVISKATYYLRSYISRYGIQSFVINYDCFK